MALKAPLRRSVIHLVNFGVIVIVMIGLPAVASLRLGGLALSSVETRHLLVGWGLAAAAVLNLAAPRVVAMDAKARRRCRDWAALYLALLGAEWLYYHGYLQFRWLKNWLLRLSH